MSQLPEKKLQTTIQSPAAVTSGRSNGLKQLVANAEGAVQRCVAAVVIQHFNGTAYLVLVNLHPILNPEHRIRKIREEYRCALCKVKRPLWSSLFTKSMIGTAQINQVIGQDLEATLQYPTVFISKYSYSEFLSHAWQQSRRLGHYESTILPKYLISSPSSSQDCLGKRGIVVRQVLSKTKVAILLLSLLVLGTILGVVVGVCTGRADVAVAVAAGIFACVTALQGLIAFLAA